MPTKIKWCINPDGSPGETLNPLTGCFGPNGTAEKPNRCKWCWAWDWAKGRLRKYYLANPHVLAGDPADPFAPRWWPERLAAIPHSGKPKGIFMVDMGDWLGDWVPAFHQALLVSEMRDRPKHRFYVLTKWPQRLAQFNPWPPNVWVGASVTDFDSFLDACHHLSSVDAKVKYLSMEPLLSWPDHLYHQGHYSLASLRQTELETYREFLTDAGVSWLIIGPLNGPLSVQYPMVHRAWLDDIEAVADMAGVAIFEKSEYARIITGRLLRQTWPK